MMNFPTDSVLMTRLADGDMSALEVIYMRYSNMVQAAIRRTSPQVLSADAEELTQDTFITLVKTIHNFDTSKSLKPWLYGIAVKMASSFKRTSWLHRQLMKKHHKNTLVLTKAEVDNHGKQYEVQQSLADAFAKLPKDQHEVMILHTVEGLKGKEIADILGIELNTVWTRIHRARKSLVQILEDTSEDLPKRKECHDNLSTIR